MQERTKRKIGFWSALAMLISAVVGIGIFFKNNSVANGVDRNGAAWLSAWVIGGILSLSFAINFSEIGSMKIEKGGGGISYYSEKTGGKWFGYFNRFNYSFFNFAINVACFSYFISETFFDFIFSISGNHEVANIPVYGHALIGVAIAAFYLILNFVSLKWTSRFQILTTIKFLPLIIAAFVGIMFITTNNLKTGEIIKDVEIYKPLSDLPADKSNLKPMYNAFNSTNFNWIKIIVVLPAVLFSYDSFIIVGTITSRVKGEEKTISKVVFIGMILIAILYSLIAISSIVHNQGKILTLLEDSLPKSWSSWLKPVIAFTLFISCLGAANALTTAYVHELEYAVSSKVFFGSEKLIKKWGFKKTWIFYAIVILTFIWSLILIPSMILETNKLVDGISNYSSLFYFAIYGLIIAFYSFKRNKMNTKKINKILFYVAASLSIIAILIIQILTIYSWINEYITASSNSWGFIGEYNYNLSPLATLMISISALLFFLIMPMINYLLVSKIEKRNPLVY